MGRLAKILAIGIVVATLPACSDGNPSSQPREHDYSLAEAQAELATRPTIEQAMASYDRLLADLRHAITEVTGENDWQSDDGSSAACTEFGKQDAYLAAEVRSSHGWSAPGISPERWPAALAAIKKLTTAAGFDQTEVARDEPNHRVLFIQGPHGAVLRVSTSVNVVLRIRTGCHRIGDTAGSATESKLTSP